MRKPEREPKECVMPNCNELGTKAGGMCSACVSWWYRIAYYSAGEFGNYIERTQYRAKRMLGRLHDPIISRVKHKTKRAKTGPKRVARRAA